MDPDQEKIINDLQKKFRDETLNVQKSDDTIQKLNALLKDVKSDDPERKAKAEQELKNLADKAKHDKDKLLKQLNMNSGELMKAIEGNDKLTPEQKEHLKDMSKEIGNIMNVMENLGSKAAKLQEIFKKKKDD